MHRSSFGGLRPRMEGSSLQPPAATRRVDGFQSNRHATIFSANSENWSRDCTPSPGGKFMSYSRKKTLISTVFLSSSMIALTAQAHTARTSKTSSAAARKVAAAPEGRTDDAIKDRIEHRLATDPSVKKYDISVKVNRGAVTLDGSVASDAQKAEAARLA